VLFEAADRLGGQLRARSARAGLRRDLIGIVDWRVAELERLGVDCAASTAMRQAPDVLAETPDLVMVATGGIPDFGPVAGQRPVPQPVWDVLAIPSQVANEVLIYDATGRHPGALGRSRRWRRHGTVGDVCRRDPSMAPEMEHHSSIIYRKVGWPNTACGSCWSMSWSRSRLAGRVGATSRAAPPADGPRAGSTTHAQVVVEHGTDSRERPLR
jgi:hypothetical protein